MTWPAPESSVTAVQQVLGNLFSAALFPLILLTRDPVSHSMERPLHLLLACVLITGLLYLCFRAPYARLEHEAHKESMHRLMHRQAHEARKRARRAAKQKAQPPTADEMPARNSYTSSSE